MLDRALGNMAGMAPGAELDMNNVTLRISLDVTGIVGFAKDFRTCASFKDAGTDELFTIIQKSGQPLELESQCASSARDTSDLLQPFHHANTSEHILGLLPQTSAATTHVSTVLKPAPLCAAKSSCAQSEAFKLGLAFRMFCSVQGAVLPDDQPRTAVHAVGPRGARGAAPVQGLPRPHGRARSGGTQPVFPRGRSSGQPLQDDVHCYSTRHTILSLRNLEAASLHVRSGEGQRAAK